MDSLKPQLQQLLEQHKAHFTVQDNGKILCTINGHTLPPRHDEVSKFIQGPKFQKLLKRHQAENVLQKYEPFIVQSKNFPLMLYCALTGQLMDKSLEAVKKHMQGKKFLRAKERFTNDEIDLKPEPSLESFGIKVPKGEAAADDDDDAAAAAAAAAGGDEAAAKQQQQQQQQRSSSKGTKQKQKQAAANGAAAANGTAAAAAGAEGSSDDDEGPAFWVPSDEGGSSEDAGEGEAGEEVGSDVDMDGEGADDDDDAELSGDPMEEDASEQQQQQQQQQRKAAGKQQAAAATGSRKQKQQLGKPEKAGKAAAAAAASGAKKKQNVSRPSSVKKAKR